MSVNLDNISFSYNKNEEILKNFCLVVKDNEITALIGDSGCGKSTVLRIISGLEKQQTGTVKLNDKVISSEKEFTPPEKRNVGMVFQDYALFPHMSVRKNIEFGIKNLSKKERKTRVEEVLNLVGLPNKINSYPHELSGGEQQRIALARSLASKPEILLLDEPFSNLDTSLKKQIRNDLKTIIKKAKITCLFVTHDHEDAYDIADSTIELKKNSCVI